MQALSRQLEKGGGPIKQYCPPSSKKGFDQLCNYMSESWLLTGAEKNESRMHLKNLAIGGHIIWLKYKWDETI